jgi:hypothetical protein
MGKIIYGTVMKRLTAIRAAHGQDEQSARAARFSTGRVYPVSGLSTNDVVAKSPPCDVTAFFQDLAMADGCPRP